MVGEYKEALEDMVWQFAYRSLRGRTRYLTTGGLSALEGAFVALEWDDPYHPPESPGCDQVGCYGWATSGREGKRYCKDHS